MLENQIGRRYAEALSKSLGDKDLDKALENLNQLSHAFLDDVKVSRFFINPSISETKKQSLVKEVCKKIGASKEVCDLLSVLVERKKVVFLKNITDYFQNFSDDRLNRVRVHVTAASPLGNNQIKKLEASLNKALGKNAILETQVDESLIGGIRLSVGSQVADATIKNRLLQLRRFIEQEEVLSELTSG